MKKIALIVALTLILAGTALPYDKERPAEEIETMAKYYTYVQIKTIGIAEGLYVGVDGKYRSRETVFKLNGSGFVYKSGFILTAAHVIEPGVVETLESNVSSRLAEPVYVKERTVLVYDYRSNPTIAIPYYIDHEHDIALLAFRNYGILEPIPYDSINGNRENIEVGDTVCAVVHQRDGGELTSDLELKYGKITAIEPVNPSGNASWWNPLDITLDVSIWPGDSGSPLFAFRDGQPILIGVIRAKYMDWDTGVWHSYAVTIPRIDRYIDAWRNN